MAAYRLRFRTIATALGLAAASLAVIPAAAAVSAVPARKPPPSQLGEGPPGLPGLMPDGRVASPPPVTSPEISVGCPRAPYGPYYYSPGAGKTVALTFDDGPGKSTARILSVLRAYSVTATFFNLGQNAAARPEEVRAEGRAGYMLGDHTWDHADLTTLSAARQASEIDRESAEQKLLVGAGPCAFRPPYGSYKATTLSLAQQRRMKVWLWSVDTEDWKANGSGSSYWVNRIIRLAEQEGGVLHHPVVLLHNQPAGNPATVLALPAIIEFFRRRGYAFVDLAGRTGVGYQVLTSDGAVHPFGAPGSGSLAGKLPAGVRPVGLAADPFTAGYWILTTNGAVSSFGAPSYGSLWHHIPAGQKVAAIAAARGGYLVLTSSGAVHNFGTAQHGSDAGKLPTGVRALALAADPATGGYWILRSDGRVDNFHARSFGSLAGKLPPGVTATAIAAGPSGGYLILTSDGAVHTFGTRAYGSEAGKLPKGVRAVGLAAAPATGGYWILTSDGAVTNFHAPWHGSLYGHLHSGRSVAAITGE